MLDGLEHTTCSQLGASAVLWCLGLLRHSTHAAQVERMREEVVQLKILQCSLMLLQSPAVADSEASPAAPQGDRS